MSTLIRYANLSDSAVIEWLKGKSKYVPDTGSESEAKVNERQVLMCNGTI